VSAPAERASAVGRPPPADLALMAVGVAAVSTSGPLIAATLAPALAIAFWRNAFAMVVIAPYTLVRHRGELARLGRRDRALTVAAGVLLAAHFATWVPSLRYTSVASSTALVALQPVWTLIAASRLGQHVPSRAWWGVAVALCGVVVLTGVDVSLSGRALVGDLLALVGGFFAAMYVTVGSRVRRGLSTASYTLVCYGTCAVLLGVACVAGRQDLAGYSTDTWVKLVALTAGAQLLGHSVFNIVLRTTSATVVSLALLFEMPGAALIAALWLGQRPPWGVLPAAALVLTGVAIVVGSGTSAPQGGRALPAQ
jgi:drug/metabolite transporter (DMT)-like permease